MDTVVPSEVWGDLKSDFDDRASDGLDAGCQVEHGEGVDQLLYLTTQPHVVYKVTYTHTHTHSRKAG